MLLMLLLLSSPPLQSQVFPKWLHFSICSSKFALARQNAICFGPTKKKLKTEYSYNGNCIHAIYTPWDRLHRINACRAAHKYVHHFGVVGIMEDTTACNNPTTALTSISFVCVRVHVTNFQLKAPVQPFSSLNMVPTTQISNIPCITYVRLSFRQSGRFEQQLN